MGGEFSAYLSLYEDWELLRPSVESMLPFIDELVVVDGAYDWMAHFVRAVGKDPACSSPRVYEQLANLGIPLNIITGTWANEHAKRTAGYEACTHRHIFAIDADEFEFVDAAAVARFVAAGHPAAHKSMPPFYHTPEWVQAATSCEPIPTKGFLFDREQIDGRQHLSYLWLVNGPDSPASLPVPPAAVEAVGVTAHMTLWRSPDGGRNRAAFYTLNYFRNHGCPWHSEFKDRPTANLDDFFAKVDPFSYENTLLTTTEISDFAIGSNVLRQSPLNAAQRDVIAPFYQKFLASHEAHNLRISSAFHYMVAGEFVLIDVSTDRALGAIERDGTVEVVLRAQPYNAVAEFHCLSADAPWEHKIELEWKISPHGVTITIPPEFRQQQFLRRVLRFKVWLHEARQQPFLRRMLRLQGRTRECEQLQEFRLMPSQAAAAVTH